MANQQRILKEQVVNPVSKMPKPTVYDSASRSSIISPADSLQRVTSHPDNISHTDIIQLQHTVGNRAVGALLDPSSIRYPIQAKLTVNAPDDKFEQEADKVAEQVTRMPTIEFSERLECHDKPESMAMQDVQRRGGGAFEVNNEFSQQLAESRSGGQHLPNNIKNEFGVKFGKDFSGVKIHTDKQADLLNQSIQSQAFTTGKDIYFSEGAYKPDNKSGKALLAHELTHVLQQTQSLEGQTASIQQSPPEIQRGKNKKETKSSNTNMTADPATVTINKDEEPTETKGEKDEKEIRHRLRYVNSESDASKLQHGIMDVIAGSSLNGTGGVVTVDIHTIKATPEQISGFETLLKKAPVQASSNPENTPWHKNEHGKLPDFKGKTPYLEFLISGFKSKNLVERAVFNTKKKIVYLTCHYDTGSFVQINGLSASVIAAFSRSSAKIPK